MRMESSFISRRGLHDLSFAEPMSQLLKAGRTRQSLSVRGSSTAGILSFISRSSKSALPVPDDCREDLWESEALARVCQGEVPRQVEDGDSILYDFPRPKCQESGPDQGRTCALEAAGACRARVWLLKRGGKQEVRDKIQAGGVRAFKKIAVSTVGEK